MPAPSGDWSAFFRILYTEDQTCISPYDGVLIPLQLLAWLEVTSQHTIDGMIAYLSRSLNRKFSKFLKYGRKYLNCFTDGGGYEGWTRMNGLDGQLITSDNKCVLKSSQEDDPHIVLLVV